jgi:signal peptidase II
VQLHYQDWYWPAFNVADSAISVGVVLLIVDVMRGNPDSP